MTPARRALSPWGRAGILSASTFSSSPSHLSRSAEGQGERPPHAAEMKVSIRGVRGGSPKVPGTDIAIATTASATNAPTHPLTVGALTRLRPRPSLPPRPPPPPPRRRPPPPRPPHVLRLRLGIRLGDRLHPGRDRVHPLPEAVQLLA